MAGSKQAAGLFMSISMYWDDLHYSFYRISTTAPTDQVYSFEPYLSDYSETAIQTLYPVFEEEAQSDGSGTVIQ